MTCRRSTAKCNIFRYSMFYIPKGLHWFYPSINSAQAITIVDEYDQEQEMYCSFVLWASGLGQVPFSRAVLETIEEQKNNRAIHVNERLQVIGGGGNLYAMGDCAHLTPEPLSNHIESLFEVRKDKRNNGLVNLGDALSRLRSNKQRLPLPRPRGRSEASKMRCHTFLQFCW